MLILNWSLPCILLLVQSAICSDIQQDTRSVKEKLSKEILTETDSYGSHHPPLADLIEKKESRKEKSINVNEQTPSPLNRTSLRVSRRRTRPKATTPNLEIPVQVIYETEPTTIQSTIPPSHRTTRIFSRRRQSTASKKLDIRETTIETYNIDNANVTEQTQTILNKETSDVSSPTEFPKRSRESHFKKRTESPAPRVKIVEEKNFVYGHSGNFHYSYLSGDGTKISSEGSLRSYDNNKTGEAVSGSVFYKDKDGNDYSLSYTADENGYRPIGAHLPTPPPLPPAIARALKYIADKSTPSPVAENE